MGGFTSLPPVYAGHKLGLKTFIHDSNARPGRANVMTSRFCTRVFLGLDAAKAVFPGPRNGDHRHAGSAGNHRPANARGGCGNLRAGSRAPDHRGDRRQPGSAAVERTVRGGAALRRRKPGAAHRRERLISSAFRKSRKGRAGLQGARVLRQMPSAYAVADLIIARSGASSLTEIAIAGHPSILVPYPYAADDHQTRNAEVFSEGRRGAVDPGA